MMSCTPQMEEEILDELAELCGQELQDHEPFDAERMARLVESLLVNGWWRHLSGSISLSTLLKRRIRREFAEFAMHRGSLVDSLVQRVQQSYDKKSRLQSTASNPTVTTTLPPRTLD